MRLTSYEFAAGAQQLAYEWAAHLPSEPPWRWVHCSAPFAAGMGGGYLARQHALPAPQPPPPQQLSAAGTAPAPQAAGGEAARSSGGGSGGSSSGGGGSSSGIASIDYDDDEEDAGNAKLAPNHAGDIATEERSCAAPTAGAAAGAPAPGLCLTCHAVYHPSFQVPVLLLEAAGRDGAPLALPALLAALPRLREAVESGQAYSVLTQEEHPFLHRPWFRLHPCQTAAVMQLLTEPRGGGEAAGAAVAPVQPAEQPAMQHGWAMGPSARGSSQAGKTSPLRYLLAWLSVVGQPLDIRVPPELWQCCL